MSHQLTDFTAWLAAHPSLDGFFHLSPERQYAHAEEDYDSQYGVVEDHPEDGRGACALLDHLEVDQTGPALEVGCGTGYLTTGLIRHSRCPALLITDPSPAFLRITRRRIAAIADARAHPEYAVLNAGDLRLLPPGTFSMIALRSTLHHILDVDEFVASCARALRPGGALIMGAEPCESGYVLMGVMAQAIPSIFRAAGADLPEAWRRQAENLAETMKFYCRRDLDKTTAEDKHLFRIEELAALGRQCDLDLKFYPNAVYGDFVDMARVPQRRSYFADFFLPYIRYCMSFDPEFIEQIKIHLRPQFDYLADCYRAHSGPVFNGVFVLVKSASIP